MFPICTTVISLTRPYGPAHEILVYVSHGINYFLHELTSSMWFKMFLSDMVEEGSLIIIWASAWDLNMVNNKDWKARASTYSQQILLC